MNVAPLALIGGLIFALTEFVTRVLAAFKIKPTALVKQSITFVVGVAVVFLIAGASITNILQINHIALAKYDVYSKVIIGLLSSGLFAVVPYNLIKAINKTTTTTVDDNALSYGTTLTPTPVAQPIADAPEVSPS